ncbi:hypothetical protein ETB97_000469, partial [Aspergillus alliaceus]
MSWIYLYYSPMASVADNGTPRNLYVSPVDYESELSNDPLTDIKNQTLGFEKVFAIGFQGRTDKHDAMTMGASVTGFTIHWMEAVDPGQMLDKAYPSSWEKVRAKPAEVGCWRAHMNVMEYIVSHQIATALIFEDDADWDVSLKSQLVEFARGARALQNTTTVPVSPYGD